MTASQVLKQELQVKIEQLPANKLQEVLDFVSFLLQQNRASTHPQHIEELALEKDPLLEFIGAVSHGSLAQEIDEELYGA